MSLSDDDIAKVAVSWYWAEALCADTSDGVVSHVVVVRLERPDPIGHVGAHRCAGDLFACVQAGGRSVTFVNYAGPMGWKYWGDYCS